METNDRFQELLDAANSVVSQWLEDGQEYNDAMISLHCACRALDGTNTPTQAEE